MSTVAQPITADDLLTITDGDRYELVDGELKELHNSVESSWVAGQILGMIGNFAEERGLGWVFPGGVGYQCFPDDPLKLRRADTSFIARDRLPEGPTGEGHTLIAPDLAVEVVSPHDTYYDVQSKVADYLEAGVQLVWVATPHDRTITVYRQDAPSTPLRLSTDHALTGDDVLPGFTCRVQDLFPPRSEQSQPSETSAQERKSNQ